MKHLTALLVLVILSISAFGQAPEGVNYQAVARDGSGAVLANQTINVRMIIHENGPTGTTVYQETHNVTTNDFGLFTLIIGQGNAQFGSFNAIDWGSASHFLQVEVDDGGGYVNLGSTQFVSVPYALYAKEAGNGGGIAYTAGTGINISGNVISNTAPDQTVTITGGGATSVSGAYPNFTISSTDSDNQTLSLSGNTLSISGGNSVTLPSGGGSSVWSTAGSNAYYTAGNVGIGTSSPVIPLHVKSSGSEIARFESDMTSSWISLYQGNTRKGFFWGVGNDLKLRADQGALAFQTGGNNVDRLHITSTGDVGIGTTNPSAQLEVDGTFLNSNGQVSIETKGESSPQYFEITRNNVGWSQDVVTIQVQSGAADDAQFIEFQRGGTVEARINTDGSAEFKNVKFDDGTVQETAAKGPIAYGFIYGNGVVASGSGNFTCTYNATYKRYEIAISGENYVQDKYSTVVTTNFIGYGVEVSISGKLAIYLYNSAGNPSAGAFQFVTFK